MDASDLSPHMQTYLRHTHRRPPLLTLNLNSKQGPNAATLSIHSTTKENFFSISSFLKAFELVRSYIMDEVEKIVKILDLEPHPEGGYYKETYRSSGTISPPQLPASITTPRNYCTGIYFLLTSKNFSAFHKIEQDEIWHHYKGSRLMLHIISPMGDYKAVEIGNELGKGQVPQYVVPAGHYFASEIPDPDTYSLSGCTVSPGFDLRDFTMPMREHMIELFPQHSTIIGRLTRQQEIMDITKHFCD